MSFGLCYSCVLSGVVVIVDDHGWKQKISISYDLNVRSYIPIGSSCEDRVFSTAWLEVTIPESTFRRSEFRSPQFGICLTTIAIIPACAWTRLLTTRYRMNTAILGQLRLSIQTRGHIYANVANTVSSEKSNGVKVQISPLPSGTIEGGAKWGKSAQIADLGTAIDLKNSSISMPSVGGLKWKYTIIPDLPDFHHRLRLGRHHYCDWPWFYPACAIESSTLGPWHS